MCHANKKSAPVLEHRSGCEVQRFDHSLHLHYSKLLTNCKEVFMAKKIDYAAMFTLRKDGRYQAAYVDDTGRHYVYDRDPERLWHKLNDRSSAQAAPKAAEPAPTINKSTFSSRITVPPDEFLTIIAQNLRKSKQFS